MSESDVHKINIEICPTLVPSPFVSLSVCKCGKKIDDKTQIGESLIVDIDSVRWARWTCYGCGSVTDVRIVDVYSELPFVPIKFTLLDLLEIGAGIPVAPKPGAWMPTKDGKVTPDNYYPAPQILN